ncbi:MAG: ThiF family adenylyltransferase [bacterium]|nr:ThiF family adenylyltransferase [bacterium]
MITEPIVVAGVGGIGSHVVINAIGRIGFTELTLYDPDIVEMHNLHNQAYFRGDIPSGKQQPLAKVKAVRRYLQAQLAPGLIRPIIRAKQTRADGDPSRYRGIVIVMTDSIESRIEIFSGVTFHSAVELYIVAGASESVGIIYALDPRDPDQVDCYRHTLRPDAAGAQAPACVDPSFGPAFAGAIGTILQRFSRIGPEAWMPTAVQVTEMNFSNRPFMRTRDLPIRIGKYTLKERSMP